MINLSEDQRSLLPENTARALETLIAGEVRRYHAAPTVQPQTIAAHCWGVAMILYYISPEAPLRVVMEALLHDVGEAYAGDMTFTAKRDNPGLKDAVHQIESKARSMFFLEGPRPFPVEPSWVALLKVADTLDGLWWCYRTERGSLIMDRWRESYCIARSKFEKHLLSQQWERADALFNYIISQHHT